MSDTSIDLTIASPDISPELYWWVLPSVLSSDHYPIQTTLAASPAPSANIPKIYNYKTGFWLQYEKDEAWRDFPSVSQYSSSSDLVEDLYKCLYSAADQCIPTIKPKCYYPKPWWNDDCKEKYKE